jgi:hypothetical protein
MNCWRVICASSQSPVFSHMVQNPLGKFPMSNVFFCSITPGCHQCIRSFDAMTQASHRWSHMKILIPILRFPPKDPTTSYGCHDGQPNAEALQGTTGSGPKATYSLRDNRIRHHPGLAFLWRAPTDGPAVKYGAL